MQVPVASASSVSRYWPTLAAAALVALSFVKIAPSPPADRGPVAVALQSASSSDRAKVASIYRALGDLMRRDSGKLIATTSMWRSVYQDALRLAAGGTDLVGKYPGLDAAVEQTLAKHYSLDVASIDQAMAAKIVDACKDVERQCE